MVAEGLIDLRSDTLTVPTPEMFAAMVSAPLGDDVYAEDPTVNALEEQVAALFGHRQGLFTPTGSMSNQLGLRTLVPAGQEVVTDAFAHIVRAELGGLAAQGGITTRTYDARDGVVDPARVAAIARPPTSPYLVGTAAIVVENTHNFGGGRVQPLMALQELRAFADETGLAMHLDGARIWNAHVATGVPLASYGSLFDTVSVCFSKGLGAPVGSMLLANEERIATARVLRKRLGAGMRQVGVLAGAARYAVEHNISRLAEDHRRAATLAQLLAAVAPEVVDATIVDTNIVLLNLRGSRWSATELYQASRAAGVVISVLGPHEARLVTYAGVSDDDIVRAADVLSPLLAPG
jgi:threonine aldolase